MSTTETALRSATLVIVGIGNDYRRDDAAGLLIARELKKQVQQKVGEGKVSVLECTKGTFELIDSWEGASTVILVDAVSSGTDPGTIYRIEAHNQAIPSSLFHYSTHGFNVAETIQLAKLLGKLPPRVVVYGIEGANFDQGEGLSEEVAMAIETVTGRLLKYLRKA